MVCAFYRASGFSRVCRARIRGLEREALAEDRGTLGLSGTLVTIFLGSTQRALRARKKFELRSPLESDLQSGRYIGLEPPILPLSYYKTSDSKSHLGGLQTPPKSANPADVSRTESLGKTPRFT